MHWSPRLSASFRRSDGHRFLRSSWLVRAVGLLLCGTGCPQLLDESFTEPGSDLSLGDASVGGTCGVSPCTEEAAGSGGGSGGTVEVGTLAQLRSCAFGEPEPILGLNFATGSEWGASLTSDGLTLFFSQSEPASGDLYRATRTNRGATFSTPVALTQLNTSSDEGTPFISADGLRLYFHSTRAGGLGGKDLYVATRNDVTAEFTSAELLENVNSSALDHLPRLSRDELTLWFTSTRAGGLGGADLWTSTRASVDAPFGAPTALDVINGSSGDESVGLTQDGLVLVFDSTRDGMENSEIFTTTRASANQAFPSPTHLSAVNSPANEYNVFLTLDERELFFSSNRSGGSRHHLFRSLRSCD